MELKKNKMKKLEDFKKNEINLSTIYGSWDRIEATGGGKFNGDLDYTSDIFADNDGDGKFSKGDVISYHFTVEGRG